MGTIKVALLGFGTVGQGVYEAIETHREEIEELTGQSVSVERILVKDASKERPAPASLFTTSIDEVFEAAPDVLFEAIVGEEPGASYLTEAIKRGIHIVTANKVLFARHGKSLLQHAATNNVKVAYEATTAGGTPIIRTLSQLLTVNRIQKIEGILNGTSNYILSEMKEKGASFEDALQQAQNKGFAEADPANDIDGSDAFCKLMILSELAFGEQPEWDRVEKQGITRVTALHSTLASQFGLAFRHIASLAIEDGEIKASVKPVAISDAHPFYDINGVDNAVKVTGSLVGDITVRGPGAGKLPTASAMIEDFIHILRDDSPVRPARNKSTGHHSGQKTDRLLFLSHEKPSASLPEAVTVNVHILDELHTRIGTAYIALVAPEGVQALANEPDWSSFDVKGLTVPNGIKQTAKA